jgi:hypothetical protein
MNNRIYGLIQRKLEATCWHDELWQNYKTHFKISTEKQNKYGKTSEMLEGFYSVISMNGLSKLSTGKDDGVECNCNWSCDCNCISFINSSWHNFYQMYQYILYVHACPFESSYLSLQYYRISRPIRRTFFSRKCDLTASYTLRVSIYFQTCK